MLMTAIAGILSGGGTPATPPDFTFDLTTGSLDAALTHSRTAIGLQFDDSGGVLFGKHNLCLRSEALDNAAWTPTNLDGTSPTSGVAPSGDLPAGVTTSCEVWVGTGGASISGPNVLQNITGRQGLSPYATRFWAGVGSSPAVWGSQRVTWADWRPSGGASLGYRMVSADMAGVSGQVQDETITVDPGNANWYKCSHNVYPSASSGSAEQKFTINASTRDNSRIYLTGVHVFNWPAVDEYVPTTTAAVYGERMNANGLLVETAAAQYIANGRTLSGWTDSSAIVSASTGVFGFVDSKGSRLTSSGTNQLVEITPTISSAELTFACWIKGITINDDVWFSPDGGTTQIPMTAYLQSGEWELFQHTFTGANPNIEIKIAASGDSFDIDMVTLAEEPFAQMPIPTWGTAVQRVADVLTITGLANSTTYNVDLVSKKIDGSDEYTERAEITSDGSGNYAFAWTDFPASDIREHRIVKTLAFYEVV